MAFFKQLYYSLEDNYYDKRWGILILKILAILVLTVCTGMVIFIVASTIINNLEKSSLPLALSAVLQLFSLTFLRRKSLPRRYQTILS